MTIPHSNPKWQERIARAAGAKQRGVTPLLSPEVQPIIIVDDLREVTDPLSEAAHGVVGFAQTSGAGNLNAFALQNPAGSGKLMRVKRILCSTDFSGSGAPGRVQITYRALTLPQLSVTFWGNTRLTGNPAALLGANLLAAPPGGAFLLVHVMVTGGVQSPLVWTPDDFLLDEGLELCVCMQGIGVQSTCGAFEWEEIAKGQRG